ncbi:MAG TPA: anti-sigma factor [Gemmatimonadaceae bacterium]|nr:anti-sigma factor [Gemmatimonadaceae bacterium]
MSDPLGHDVVREMLALDALDALTPEERAALDRHLTTCAECTGDLATLREAAAAIGTSLPPRPMPTEREAAMRARLLARAIDDRAGVTPIRRKSAPQAGASTRPAPARPTVARWLAAAAFIIAIGAIAYDISLRATIQRLSVARAELRDSTSALQRRLADQQAILDGLTAPGVRVMDAGATNARQPYGRMFWDQPTNRWTFVAHNLPAAAPGHTYQLWLVTRDQRKVSAGTFAPTASGSAIVRATYALAPDSLAAIAVTNEPAGGSAQPTTTPILVGPSAKSD